MHKIYFEKRCIIICPPDEQALTDPNAIQFSLGDASEIHSLIGMFEQSESLHRIYIPTGDTSGTYRKICNEFKEVNAGGGLVSNRRGDFLLINRNGLWDLPKGHQEEGEDIKITSLREVQEETGVNHLELGRLICITDHCYKRDGIWHLKHTWWFDALYGPGRSDTAERGGYNKGGMGSQIKSSSFPKKKLTRQYKKSSERPKYNLYFIFLQKQ